MNRIIFFLTIILCSVTAEAAEPVTNYRISVDDFDDLKVIDGICVDYYCDPAKAGLVEFEATKEVASAVIFDQSKGKLKVSLASRETPYTGLPRISVYSSHLSSISNEGDSLVRVMSHPKGARFSCRIIGNGRLTVRDLDANSVKASILSGRGVISITGSCREVSLKIVGVGTIQADDLEAEKVNCSMAGTGTINCFATKDLIVGGLGGTVNYRGNPKVKKRLLTTVKIIPMD